MREFAIILMNQHEFGRPFSVDGQLKINEIYLSVQGESTWAGLPCVFVRLTGCDSRCSYCDTEYAFYEGVKKSLHEVFAEVLAFECPLVEITGGEPLLKKNVLPIMTALCNADRTVLIETSGAHWAAARRSPFAAPCTAPGATACSVGCSVASAVSASS